MSETSSSKSKVDRRGFVKSAAAGVVAVSAAASTKIVFANDVKTKEMPKSETLVAKLYKSLNEKQHKSVCFKFDDPLRNKVGANWHITKARIKKDFTKDQQEMIREIFNNLHSEQYAKAVLKQVEHDNRSGGGFGNCSIALFGDPGKGGFEFVFSGRHVTRRCDGDSVKGAAFGGPIFYGHAAESDDEKPNHPGNAYWFQALRANELFKALDGKQQKKALLGDSRGERGTTTVKLKGKKGGFEGIPVSELSNDQKELAHKVMSDLLAPFRKEDREESMKLVQAAGTDNLHFSFYKNEDVGSDKVWDTWQVEGPSMVWYFRGDPHVHTWVHIREPVS